MDRFKGGGVCESVRDILLVAAAERQAPVNQKRHRPQLARLIHSCPSIAAPHKWKQTAISVVTNGLMEIDICGVAHYVRGFLVYAAFHAPKQTLTSH